MQCNRILAFVGVMLAVSGSSLVAGAQNAPRTGSFGGAHSGTATGKMNGMRPGMGSIVGNKKTHVYHLAGDKSTLPAEKNRAYFRTEAQAMAAGYHAAGQKKSPVGMGKLTGHGMPSTTPLHTGMKH